MVCYMYKDDRTLEVILSIVKLFVVVIEDLRVDFRKCATIKLEKCTV